MFPGVHLIENINRKDRPFFRCFEQGRIVPNPQILSEPVYKGIFLHRSGEVKDKKFAVFSGKEGDLSFVTERRAIAGLDLGAVQIQPALYELNPEMPTCLSGILQRSFSFEQDAENFDILMDGQAAVSSAS